LTTDVVCRKYRLGKTEVRCACFSQAFKTRQREKRKGTYDMPKELLAAIEAWEFFKEQMHSGDFDMIILDEINYALAYRFLALEEVLETIQNKPDGLHLVLTGRNAHPRVIEIADLVTEMKEIKHPFQKAMKAQRGIEF
jgi:cob(I)alamin adenosyltransferase